MGTGPGALGRGQLMPASGQPVSGGVAKGSGRRSPRSLARTTSIPYRISRTWFFMPVTITHAFLYACHLRPVNGYVECRSG